jgi:hypothetical protein
MDAKLLQDSEFLFRRTQETFSNWTIALPVVFACLVVLLIALFKRENRLQSLLWSSLLVFACAVVYIPLALIFKPVFSWWVVLAPVLAVALIYVVLMYKKDSQSIHPAWAAFLGLSRCLVYAILAFVFMLPGCQTYDTNESHAKVLLLFDVSGSMGTVDALPTVGQDPATLPTRQDEVIEFLTGQPRGGKNKAPFIDRLLAKSPATAYRFGSLADDQHVLNLDDGKPLPADEWSAWLKPDKKKIVVPTKLSQEEQFKLRARLNDLYDSLIGGTNVPGSALQVARMEAGSFLQGIVIVSDGQSNVGGGDALKEFLDRVNNSKKPVPVFTIGVGEYRQPVSIRIEDLQAPEVARPDDKFPIRVPVIGAGLADEEFDVTLEMQRIKDKDGKEVTGDKKFVLGPQRGKFKGAGDNPHDQVEFVIDMQDLTKIDAAKDEAGQLEGTWKFIAHVPRHKNEAFPKDEHVSDPATYVLVQKRKLRALLFAGGPSRDYQFLRTLLYREVLEKRMDLAVFLQTGRDDDVNQDVEGEWLLRHFPDKLGPDSPLDKHSTLNEYDVIIAFDPDWTLLETKQLEMLKEWVGTHAGGIIFVAGPVHTFHLARPGGIDLSALLTIYPVVLKDSRLHGLGIGHDASRPYALHFTPAAKLFEFLKLDENGKGPTAGWDQFFWRGDKPEASKDIPPARGFFNYYPVEKIKPGSTVVATFAGPTSSRINDGKDEQPFFVSMPFGGGKTFYVGSAESWRLRQFKQAFHERFWIKLVRFVSAGTSMQKKYGLIAMSRNYPTGTITFEAQIKGADLQPLPRDATPTVQVKRPEGFDPKLDPDTPETFEMRPKPTEGAWQGWFTGSFKVRTPGEYEIKIPIPATSEALYQRFIVRQPNIELDNVRNNFKELYRLASDIGKLAVDPPTRKEIEKLLRPPADEDYKELSTESKESARLFLPLKDADAILKCLRKVQPKKESTKGRLIDLWDDGFGREALIDAGEVSAYWLLLLGPLGLALLAGAILLTIRRTVAGLVTIGLGAILALVIYLIDQVGTPPWENVPIDMSFVLAVVVTLLSIEWLTRKLLKLA